MVQTILMVLLFVTAVFMILLVLVQRGKGGGLAGAFGGMGGQSAFGTKAGDLFTRITVGVAAFWIILCLVTVKYMGSVQEENKFKGIGPTDKPGNPAAGAPADPDRSGNDGSE
ncbi:MAG: preprotein translocase subunit SecG [Thermoguttaceae bacterium]